MDNGIVNTASPYSVDETLQHLETLLEAKGINIFARIDHSGEAAKVGMEMHPTKLLIFGSPKGGTPVMLAAPTSAIDLPLKALVWRDASGTTWLSYNDPAWVVQRHGLDEAANATVNAMTQALHAIASKATTAA